MSQRPFTCPECSTFVRHDWLNECGACGAVLRPGEDSAASLAAAGVKANAHWYSAGTLFVIAAVVVALVGGSVAAFGTGGTSSVAQSTSIPTTGTTTAPATTTSTVTTTTLPPTTLVAADAKWVSFTDSKKRFKAQFPVKPKLSSKTDGDFSVDAYASSADSYSVEISVFARPDGDGDQVILDGVAPLLTPAGADVVRSSDGEATGFKFRDSTLVSSSFSMQTRVLVSKKQVYLIMVSGPPKSDVSVAFTKLSSSFAVQSKG